MPTNISDVAQRIQRLKEFKDHLQGRGTLTGQTRREWLNQNAVWVRREIAEAGCFMRVTISPPPAVGGLVAENVDPFAMMFDAPYGLSLIPTICDMIDRTIGVLLNPSHPSKQAVVKGSVQKDFAFVAMAMDENDHQLVDVLEAIKEAASKCGIAAERVDDSPSSERITDRIIESLRRAEFVVVDLTHERFNVYWEAGFAHALGKTPVYVARKGTKVHFDIKDYPITEFRSMKELKDGLTRRLMSIRQRPAA